jgi:ABC-type phosphate/phosphonate transport system substrate-binding protein
MLALLLAAALTPALRGQAAGSSSSVRIGVPGSFCRNMSEGLMQVVLRPFRQLMEVQTGMQPQLVACGDAENLGRLLKEGRIQLAVFHGFEFAWARQKYPELRPLVIAVNGQHCLRAHLVVRKNGQVHRITDLQGQKVALPHRSREHCRLFMERRCVPPGSLPEDYYSNVAIPRNAEDAIEDVLDSTVQAAIIDEADLEAFRKNNPDRSGQLNSLLQSEAFPGGVIAYVPGALSEATLQRFHDGLLAARETDRGRQMLQMSRISSFADVPTGFDQMLSDIAQAYPPAGH